MASMRKRGLCHISFAGFSHGLRVEKWIQFHASHVNKALLRGWEDG